MWNNQGGGFQTYDQGGGQGFSSPGGFGTPQQSQEKKTMENLSSPTLSIMSSKVVSFKVYLSAEKPKMKAAYPFLSVDQINKKIKRQWKSMTPEKQRSYTKTSPKPKKVKEKSKNRGRPRKDIKESSSDQDSQEKIVSKQTDMDVCDTPEYINTHKLRDFHNTHKETYENDFAFNSPVKEPTQSLATFRKAQWCHSSDMAASENRCIKQHGILKDSFSNSDKKSRQESRVSFNSQTEEHILSQYSHDYHSGDDADDDNTAYLIQRRMSEESKDSHSTDNVAYVNNPYINDDDDDDDDRGVLITRESIGTESDGAFSEDGAKETELMQSPIKETSLKPDITGKLDSVDKTASINSMANTGAKPDGKNSAESQEDVTEENGSLADEPFQTSFSNNRNGSKHYTYGKKTNNDFKSIKTYSSPDDDWHDKLATESKDGIFKSPLKDIKSGRKRKIKENNTAEALLTPTQPMLKTGSFPQITPNVAPKVEADSYTTPQMDEVLQQLALDEVNKAPQKQKQCQNSINVEKTNAALAGRRVTRSLLSSPGTENVPAVRIHSKNCEKLAANGNKRKNGGISKQNDRRSNKKNKLEGKGGSRNCDNVVVPTNPSGDACQDVSPVNKSANQDGKYAETKNVHEIIEEGKFRVDRKNCSEAGQSCDMGGPCDPARKTMTLMTDDETQLTDVGLRSPYVDGTDWSQNSILDICSSPISTGPSPGNRNGQGTGTNPALQKALLGLKIAAVINSPAGSLSTASDGLSPKLLSPALSGISELSSNSSSQSKVYSSDLSLISLGSEDLHTAVDQPGGDLCQMFDAVKSPDRKSAGAYVTKRLAMSNADYQSQEIFQDDPDFPFT